MIQLLSRRSIPETGGGMAWKQLQLHWC